MKAPFYATYLGFNPTGDLGPFTIYTNQYRRPVFYIKAPPTSPPTTRQSFLRENMKEIAAWWSAQSSETKALWEAASKNARLRMNGYALFQWWQWKHDPQKLQTIMRQSKIQLPLG